ncbi:MAG: NAD(P)-dependent oxidoreductase [Patescibacteria group bacterium]|nr:hypothetical protein [Patescibacteria group bacterium]
MKITIVDKINRFASKDIKTLQKNGDVMFTPLNSSALKNLPIKVYNEDVILVIDPEIYNWKIGNEVFKLFKNLKAVCLPTTSFECLDLDYFKKNKITVTNTPSYSTQAVAEYAIWMMMSLVRKLPMILRSKMDIFNPFSIQEEIKGKTMGVIGLGNIGKRIAEYGDRMGMRVFYWSRSDKDVFWEKVKLGRLLERSDFVFPCYEINRETKKIFKDKKNIDKIKSGAYLVIPIIGGSTRLGNESFDFRLLKKYVREGKLSGLAYESPNLEKSRSNIFTPPPVAWYTKEAQDRCYQMVTNTVLSVIKGCPENRVV